MQGLERRLKEAIPEISDVVQAMPDTPPLEEAAIDGVLEGIRPFLTVAGGTIEIASLTGVDSIQPQLVLKMEGASSSVRSLVRAGITIIPRPNHPCPPPSPQIQSVKLEIMQRIQRHFMISGLRIEFE